MKHILGVKGTRIYNLDTQEYDYTTKIIVSQDVIDFLENHDVKKTSDGKTIYIMNKVKYVYLGIQIDFSIIDKPNIQHIKKEDFIS